MPRLIAVILTATVLISGAVAFVSTTDAKVRMLEARYYRIETKLDQIISDITAIKVRLGAL